MSETQTPSPAERSPDEETRRAARTVACLGCGNLATVTLGWRTTTAWTAQVLRYQSPSGCIVDEVKVLRRLGLDGEHDQSPDTAS